MMPGICRRWSAGSPPISSCASFVIDIGCDRVISGVVVARSQATFTSGLSHMNKYWRNLQKILQYLSLIAISGACWTWNDRAKEGPANVERCLLETGR
jgi:hypothetical protein